MPRIQAPELKVTLDTNNSRGIRETAKAFCTTPPRIVNRIIEEWLQAAPAPQPMMPMKQLISRKA